MATETHIAGLDIHWDGRYVQQRCAWCGATLIAMDLSRVSVMVVEGEETKPPACWPVGALVRCHYDGTVASFGGVSLSRTVKEVVEPESPADFPDNVVRMPADACVRHLPIEDE